MVPSRIIALVLLVTAVGSLHLSAQNDIGPAEGLLRMLPRSDALVVSDGTLVLRGGVPPVSFPIVGTDTLGGPVITVGERRIRVAAAVLRQHRVLGLPSLSELLDQAVEAEVSLDSLIYHDSLFLGPHLRGEDVLVIPEGVLQGQDLPAKPSPSIKALVAALKPWIAASTLSGPAQRALATVLALMDESVAGEDEVDPALVRRLVSWNQWLPSLVGDGDDVVALRDGVRNLDWLRPSFGFSGPAVFFVELSNHFGRSGALLVTWNRCTFWTRHPIPAYEGDPPYLDLVVHYPPSSNPMEHTAEALSAEVSKDGKLLATWDRERGFTADDAAWSTAWSASRASRDKNALSDYLPPHLVIPGLDGSMKLIATRHGTLLAPRSGEPAEAERFLSDAARILVDPAHLDLLGEYFFSYVFDSPDPRRSDLIGSREFMGEIHQTAHETLSTAVGGQCRGDCDDLAEVYQEILTRQGHLAHIMDLPDHNAVAMAEVISDDRARVTVLQTGQPLRFTGKDVPTALRGAYQAFHGDVLFDPEQVALSLRFSGENVRSTWFLSHRVFTEPEYAATMIDIQRDWHLHTYHRAIDRMQALSDGGDQDPANLREMAGLYDLIGAFDEAAAWRRRALAVSADDALALSSALVWNLYRGERAEEARALVQSLVTEKWAGLLVRQGPAFWSSALSLINTVIFEGDDYELGLRLLTDHVLSEVIIRSQNTMNYIGSRRFDDDAWLYDDAWVQNRTLLRTYFGIVTGLVRRVSLTNEKYAGRLGTLVDSLGPWIKVIGIRDIDTSARILDRYADIGAFYRAAIGPSFEALVRAAPMPESIPFAASGRRADVTQMVRDLPLIRASTTYWTGELAELFSRRHDALDRDAVERYVAAAEEALKVTEALGLADTGTEHQMLICRFIRALVTEDAKGLSAHLNVVRERDDKFLREDSASWISLAARHFSESWFLTVVTEWDQVVAAKATYFQIAWGAAANGAPKHALVMGELAARRFHEDPAMVEEFRRMSVRLQRPR